MTEPIRFLPALVLGWAASLVGSPEPPQTAPPPAWPSAVAVSPDGAWVAIGFVSEPARVETWTNGKRRGAFDLAEPERAHAVHIGNDGRVTAGLSRMAARTPYVSLVQASADGRVLRRCQIYLADPYVDRPTQWRGVQELAVNGLVVFAVSVEGGVHRVHLGDCSLATLQLAPAGDAERPARLTAGDGIVSAKVEDRPLVTWRWSGEPAPSGSTTSCVPPDLELPSTAVLRQRVSSSDCQVSLVRTEDAVYRCEAGTCARLWPPEAVSSVP